MIDSVLPDLPFSATSGISGKLHDFKGQWLILYFYPKDATPGCTQEGLDFRDNFDAFKKCHATIFGISRDTLASHEKFKAKQAFPFELISDTDEALCNAFDVIKQKNMFGKTVRGIQRTTFLIDPNLNIVESFRKVNVKDHVTMMLDLLKKHQAKSL